MNATLLLRSRTGPVTAELAWSEVTSDGPAVLLLRDPDSRAARPTLADELARSALAVVLELPPDDAGEPVSAEFSLGWLADHAGELGADPTWLVVVGVGAAAATAATLACRAAADGWPTLTLHVLATPDPPTLLDPPVSPGAHGSVCPCVLVVDPAVPDGPYVRALRAAGVPVQRQPPHPRLADTIARAIRERAHSGT
jgi:hypothetical protein